MTTYWTTPGGSPPTSGSDPLNLSPTASAALYRQELLALSDTIRVAKTGAIRPNPAPGAAAAALQSLQNSNLFFTEILYPSVIPLPGTLPHTPGHATSPGSRSNEKVGSKDEDNSSDSVRSRSRPESPVDRRPIIIAPPPFVRSSELKFGIDRILKFGEKKEERLNDDMVMVKDKIFLSTPGAGSLPPVLAACPCSAPTCSLVFSPLAYPTPHHQHHHHHVHGLPGHPNSLSGYGGHRPSEFPGPFALLTSAEQSPPHHPSHPGSHQPKRKRSWSRAVFSNLQRKGLEKRFEIQKYVTKPDRRQLAAMLGLTDAQVKVWFQNRRMKWRHQEEAKRKKEEEDSKKPESERGNDEVRSHSPIVDAPGDDSCGMVIDDDDDSDIDVDDDDDDDDAHMVEKCMHPFRLTTETESDNGGDLDMRGVVTDEHQSLAPDTDKRSVFGDNLDNSIGTVEQNTNGADNVQ